MQYNHGYTAFMKTAISIPDTLFQTADSLAEELGVSRSQLFRIALEAYIASHSRERIRQALDAVYADEDSSIDADLMSAQVAVLEDEDW